jgi:hypothetical protein
MNIIHIIRKVLSKVVFLSFERLINPVSLRIHDGLLTWADDCVSCSKEQESEMAYAASGDERVKQGYHLANETKRHFYRKYHHLRQLRVLVHVPSSRRSPGGYSLFNNLAQSLQYLGIETACLGWDETIHPYLDEFRPTVFLTSDSPEYLARIDWEAVRRYRLVNVLHTGLTASISGYGNQSAQNRIAWAKQHQINFYYSFHSTQYLEERVEYQAFIKNNFPLFSVEFGANPLLYYPIPNINRDLDYVFLASSNYDKRPRYYEYLGDIFSKYVGLIDGPGWIGIKRWAPPDAHRFLYARARVGINLHIQESIDWPNELNERTYILAACGVPQLVDNAKLLTQRFSEDALFIARTPKDYNRLFEEILANPDQAQQRALKAQREVFERHTTFHRAEKFALDLLTLFTN